MIKKFIVFSGLYMFNLFVYKELVSLYLVDKQYISVFVILIVLAIIDVKVVKISGLLSW